MTRSPRTRSTEIFTVGTQQERERERDDYTPCTTIATEYWLGPIATRDTYVRTERSKGGCVKESNGDIRVSTTRADSRGSRAASFVLHLRSSSRRGRSVARDPGGGEGGGITSALNVIAVYRCGSMETHAWTATTAGYRVNVWSLITLPAVRNSRPCVSSRGRSRDRENGSG